MHHSLRRGTWASYLKGGAETTPRGQISQLEVCQLLITGLHVAYSIGLNGCKEPIITLLLESLANGISLTGGKSVYLEIDIPQSPADEPDQKAPPIGKLSTIIITSPHKTTPKIRRRGQHDHGGKEPSNSSDVGHVWSWVRGLNPEETKPSGHPYTSTLQAEGTPQTIGTSSQVSAQHDAEMAEASLEGLPTTIPPIAMTTRSRSTTPSADAAKLLENANKALKELLVMKASIDTHR